MRSPSGLSRRLSDEARAAAAPERQLAKANNAPEREALQEADVSSAPAFADSDSPRKETLASDLAAPPPPAGPAQADAAQTAAEPAVITARAQPKRDLRAAAESSSERFRSDAGGLSTPGFAGGRVAPAPAQPAAAIVADQLSNAAPALRIEPPAGVKFEAVPGADGKVTLRYFDPDTGVLMIVDVDAP